MLVSGLGMRLRNRYNVFGLQTKISSCPGSEYRFSFLFQPNACKVYIPVACVLVNTTIRPRKVKLHCHGDQLHSNQDWQVHVLHTITTSTNKQAYIHVAVLSPATFKHALVLYNICLYMQCQPCFHVTWKQAYLYIYLVSAVDQLCRLRCDNMIIKQETQSA